MLSGAGDWIVHVGAVLVGIAVGIGPTGGESASAAEEGEKKKEEEKVDVYEAEKKKKRPTLKDEEKGPKFGAEDFIARKNFQSVKKQDEAIMRLKDLLESTAKENPERAEILFNLSEMYWNKSKYYEQEAFRKQDQCYKLRDAGKKKEAQACKRQMQRMLDESKRLRKEAAGLYKKIIRNYPNYDQLDDVLYYLGTNLKEVGKHQEALKVFRKLLNNFPDTQYAADVWLSFGDYYFDKKSDPDRALKFYKKVQNFENSDVYAYARYKAAWCYYNLGRKKKALDVFVDVIEYAKAHPDKPNATSLIDQARKDIVLTYADFGSPDKAIPFFRELTGDERKEVMEMAERLAIHYADNAKYDESTEMYRRLIELNKKSIETIDYQYEIVRNYTTQDPYSKKAVKELITLMKLVQYARDGRFEGHDQKTFDEKRTKAEQYVRQWATRYHREAQVTKSEALYKMASYIYKHYLKTFPNSEKIYAMTFFAGELQYHLENWPKAAKLYEKALSLKKDGEYTKEAAHGAVLAYFK
ncbi:MAG: tetratricopeptide repeat protein, partial [Bradymonadaceae bacterium]